MPPTTYEELYRRYLDFLNWIPAKLGSLGYSITCPHPDIRCVDGEVDFSTPHPIHCAGWPFKPGSWRKTIDIVLCVNETVVLDQGDYRRATVRLNYLKKEDGVHSVVESIRYDCEIPVQPRHPIYHAHLSNEVLEPPESLRDALDCGPIEARHGRIRIPTAFVNLPAVLAILASDHMDKRAWNDFMPALVGHCVGFPTVPEALLTAKLIAEPVPGAWHWYDLAGAGLDSED